MTFISNSQKFIFVHLHKCGGTSIERALAQGMQWNDIVLGSSNYGEALQKSYEQEFGLYKHSSAYAIKQIVGDDLWKDYFTFALVRHPIDRVVSYYSYLNTCYLGSYRGFAIRFMYTVDQMVTIPPALTEIPKLYDAFRWPGVTAGLKSKNISEFIHSEDCWQSYAMMSQFDQLADESGTELIIEHITRLEDISTDWNLICQRLGIDIELPHANKSKRRYKDWKKYFSLDDINFLEVKYKKDLEAFEYKIG